MLDLSPEVKALLTRAGWHEGRRIDTTPWRRALLKEGFVLCGVVEDLLTSVGGLRVEVHTGPGCAYLASPVTLDPLLEGSMGWKQLRKLQRKMGMPVVPIGLTEDDGRIVVTDDSRVMCASVDWLFLAGKSIREGLDGILVAKTRPTELEL